MPNRTYGWKPDFPDHRDFLFSLPAKVPLPAKSANRARGLLPPIWDQGQTSSCTGHGVGRVLGYERAMQALPPMDPSRLFLYYNGRRLEGSVAQDDGAQIRDVIKGAVAYGDCPYNEWPTEQRRVTLMPPPAVYGSAAFHKTLQYSRVTQTDDLYFFRHCMGILQRPIVLGIMVFKGFESDEAAETGIIPMPAPRETPLGGHCVVAVDYDDDYQDARQVVECDNSWGPDWGIKGSFKIPYAYLANPGLCDDPWVIQKAA